MDKEDKYNKVPWSFRRKWFQIIGWTGVFALVASVIADAFLATNITSNVFLPTTTMLGAVMLGYIWGRGNNNVDGS